MCIKRVGNLWEMWRGGTDVSFESNGHWQDDPVFGDHGHSFPLRCPRAAHALDSDQGHSPNNKNVKV